MGIEITVTAGVGIMIPLVKFKESKPLWEHYEDFYAPGGLHEQFPSVEPVLVHNSWSGPDHGLAIYAKRTFHDMDGDDSGFFIVDPTSLTDEEREALQKVSVILTGEERPILGLATRSIS